MTRHRSIPSFHPVPSRTRHDGWTPLRQAEFIGELAETRSVCEAARRVGMTRKTAYRLRRRKWSDSFCTAWDAALDRPFAESHRQCRIAPGKVTLAELQWRVDAGVWRVILVRGRYAGCRRKADNSALLALISRLRIAPARLTKVWRGR